MATNRNAGGGAAPGRAENNCKATFSTPNSAPTWRAVQREHAARASALVARGIHYRREIRVRTRL